LWILDLGFRLRQNPMAAGVRTGSDSDWVLRVRSVECGVRISCD
jgi:hypothetical protein